LHSGSSTFGAKTQEGAEELICLTVEGEKVRPQQCVPLHDVDMATLIENAIFMPVTPIYAETLAVVERLLEHEE
jgi:hypothetical protein